MLGNRNGSQFEKLFDRLVEGSERDSQVVDGGQRAHYHWVGTRHAAELEFWIKLIKGEASTQDRNTNTSGVPSVPSNE